MARVQRERLAYTDDRFSMLPDEVLGLILSSLSLKEAIATSILCSRLRYSWIFTSNLDLHIDYYAALQKQPKNYDPSTSRTHTLQCMYVKWVDRLLFQQLPKSSTNLVKFRLSFHLSSSFAVWINDWLNYLISRKIEILDLTLIEYSPEKRYSFPYKQGNFPDNLKLLKKLCLHSVNVSGKAVAFMLGNCRLLEQLSLSETDKLSSLEVVGTSSAFKCLAISQCNNLKSIVIRESEVVCIKYGGARCRRFVLADVPLLTQLWIQADPHSPYFTDIKGILKMFRSVLPQLHTLKIYATSRIDCMFTIKKKMSNLKELVVVIGSDYCNKCSILPWFKVAPYLQRFVVEASYQEIDKEGYNCDNLHDGSDVLDRDKIIRLWNRDKKIRKVYSHVKEVEFIGYRGVFNHLQLIAKFVKHGVALEKIIVDPRSFELSRHMPWDHISRNHTDDEIVARNRARDQLKYSRINVNIL